MTTKRKPVQQKLEAPLDWQKQSVCCCHRYCWRQTDPPPGRCFHSQTQPTRVLVHQTEMTQKHWYSQMILDELQ